MLPITKFSLRSVNLAIATMVVPVLLPFALASCGNSAATVVCGTGTSEVNGICTPDNNLQCGSGTYEVMGACSPFDPNDSQPPVTIFDGPPTPSRVQSVGDVRLYTEPEAHIFYTTDGSEPSATSANEPENVLLPQLSYADAPLTLKFYAVDKAGNQEATQEVVLRYDVTPPGPVTNLQIVKQSDGSAKLTWTNPSDADFAGVVVYRPGKKGIVVAGTAVTASDFVFVGTDSTAPDSPPEAYIDYRVVAFDTLYNYGPAATQQYDNSPVLVGSTGWQLTSIGGVTAGANLGQGITFGVQYVSGSTFALTATNNTTLITYHAPKVLFTNIVDGTWGDGTVGGETYVRVGVNGVSLAPGQSLTKTFTVAFSGAVVAGVQTATADLSFRGDDILVSSKEHIRNAALTIIDLATFSEIGLMAKDTFRPGRKGGMQGVTSRRGERYIWSGNRSQGDMRKIDTTTWTTVSVANIGQGYNLVAKPFWSGQGGLWVALSTDAAAYIGSDRSGNAIGCYLVEVDPSSMQELRRIKVDQSCHLRNAQLVPGSYGSKVAIVNHNGGVLYIVDLLAPADAAVRAIRDISIPPTSSFAITADGATAYIANNNDSITDGVVAKVAISTGNVTVLDNQRTRKVFRTKIDSTGKVWFVDDVDVTVMDPADNNSITTDTAYPGDSILFRGDRVYLLSSNTLVETDLSHSALRTLTGLSESARGHNLDLVR